MLADEELNERAVTRRGKLCRHEREMKHTETEYSFGAVGIALLASIGRCCLSFWSCGVAQR